jgi:DNA-binding NtrC family response regulator
MNVLIVDDDMGMRLTLQRIVEGEGHRVVVASDGNGALAVAEAECVDVAFVDYKMVGMNGGDTCAALHRLRPAAALYVMTAHVSSEAADAALAGGAAGILHKPLDVDRLLGLIEACAQEAPPPAPEGGL